MGIQKWSAAAMAFTLGACGFGNGSKVPASETTKPDVYSIAMRALDGQPAPLEAYRGQVTLMVNTASECGFTPQLEGLQSLHDELAPQGFAVLGFPCNDFGGQESGTTEEIQTFCKLNYGVTFPLFEKVTIKGSPRSPLYEALGSAIGTTPSWNFGKYLIGKDGQVLEFFGTRTKPGDKKLRAAIDAALNS